MKKKIIILCSLLVLIASLVIGIVFVTKENNKIYSYEWIKENDSVINQQRLYVNNKNKKHIEGYVRITYINDNSEKIKINKEGKLFVKSIIKDVKIINKR